MEWFESLKVDEVQPAARRWSAWDRLLVAVLAATLLAMLGFLFFPLLSRNWAMASRLRQLEVEQQTQEQRGLQLSREIRALQSDRNYIERVAREKLNLAAPGETLFQFGTATAVPPPNRPASPR